MVRATIPSSCIALSASVTAALLAIATVPTVARAQVSGAEIERAAAEGIEARAPRVLACLPTAEVLSVDVRFDARGVVSAVDLGPGTPETLTLCVLDALWGMALPGPVPDGTTVRHELHAPPPPPPPGAPTPAPGPVAVPPSASAAAELPTEPSASNVPPRPWYSPAAPIAPPAPAASEARPRVPTPLAEQPERAYAPPPRPATTERDPAGDTLRDDAERGRLDVGRYALEVLVGVAAGAAVSYGVYGAMCGDGDCFDAALAGMGADALVAPLAIWGIGRALGGRGDLVLTYLGGLTAFSGASAPADPALGVAVGMVVMPLTSALLFELTSQIASVRAAAELAARSRWRAGVAPIYGRGGLQGANLVVGRAF